MLRQMFKLMWNRKRRNMLLMIEMLISFLVVFAIISTALGWGLEYLGPIGFKADGLWAVHIGWEGKVKDQTRAEVREIVSQFENEISAFDEIEGRCCWSYSNTPYSTSRWIASIDWQGQKVGYHYIIASDSYADVLEIEVADGTWFGPENDASNSTPVVISRSLEESLFGSTGEAVGQVIIDDDDEYLVMGVVEQFRYLGELDSNVPIMFARLQISNTASAPPTSMLFRVRQEAGLAFEKRLADRLSAVAPEWAISVEDVGVLRDEYFQSQYMLLLMPTILGGFLVFNVALGLFGVLWYSINRRRSELGLRRALGASSTAVNRQILGEALVLATFAIAVGVVLAIQAPLLGLMGDSVSTAAYMLAILGSAALIYLLTLGCAWYPAYLASQVHPAEALHDE